MLILFINALNRITHSVTVSYLIIATSLLFTGQLLAGAYQIMVNYQQAETNLTTKVTAQSRFLAAVSVEYVFGSNFLALENLVRQTSQDPDVIYAVAVHNDGRILTQFLNFEQPLVAELLTHKNNSTDMRSRIMLLRQLPTVHEIRSPIESEGINLGEIWLGYSTHNLDSQLNQSRWNTVLSSFGLSCILVALTMIFLNWQVKKPLDEVTALAINLTFEGATQPVEITGDTEIDKLKNAFNAMTTQLGQTMSHLRLREIEARKLSYVASHTSNMVVIADPQGNIEWVNQAFTQFTGYSLPEVVGKRPRQFLHGETTAVDVVEYMQGKVHQQENFSAEVINYKKDGTSYWASIDVQPVYDDQGQLQNLIAIEFDITQRKMIEQQISDYATEVEESNKQLQGVLESALDCIISIDQEGLIIEFNPAAEKTFGYQRQQVLGQSMAKLIIPPEFHEAHYAGLRRYLATGQAKIMRQRLELTATHALGYQFPIEININPIKLGEKHIFTAFLRDITERKRAEEALHQSETRYRGIVNSQTELVCRFLRDTTLTFVNEAYCDYYQVSPHNLIGRSFLDLLPSEEHALMLSRIMLLVERQQIITYERQVVDDGWQQWTIIVITNSQGEVIELQAVGRDITALKESEVELKKNLAKERELGELKSRFVTMASHEFRTPLASIMSTASFLEMAESKIDTAKRLNRLQKIQNSAREMTVLLDDMLTYGKAEAKSFTYQPKPLDFSKFCEQIIEDIQASVKQHQIVCVDECVGQTFWLDEQILRHIVTNLISNAIKYSPQADKVQVWLGQENGYLIFQVVDSGIGIPLKEQKHLFEPFHRATNTQDIRGTGLGLAIVKKAVEAHQATIEFTSTPNVGTTFTVKFPTYRYPK